MWWRVIDSALFYSWGRQWHPTPVPLLGRSHGQRSLVGCSPWGHWESDTTEQLHFHFSLSCIGEGNGNPLQCSCLENPRDGEAGGLPFMGSHRVGYDWSDLVAVAVFCSLPYMAWKFWVRIPESICVWFSCVQLAKVLWHPGKKFQAERFVIAVV